MSAIQNVDPKQAHAVLDQDPQARLIDVRTTIEFGFIGHPIGAIHIPLKEFPDMATRSDFVANVQGKVPNPDIPLVLMCRSGVRSMEAAKLLEAAGYTVLYNMDEGFEGDKDALNHRGTLGGWRFHGLPWEQS